MAELRVARVDCRAEPGLAVGSGVDLQAQAADRQPEERAAHPGKIWHLNTSRRCNNSSNSSSSSSSKRNSRINNKCNNSNSKTNRRCSSSNNKISKQYKGCNNSCSKRNKRVLRALPARPVKLERDQAPRSRLL